MLLPDSICRCLNQGTHRISHCQSHTARTMRTGHPGSTAKPLGRSAKSLTERELLPLAGGFAAQKVPQWRTMRQCSSDAVGLGSDRLTTTLSFSRSLSVPHMLQCSRGVSGEDIHSVIQSVSQSSNIHRAPARTRRWALPSAGGAQWRMKLGSLSS